jgi:hypothetical protein
MCSSRNMTKQIGAFHDYKNATKNKPRTPLTSICLQKIHSDQIPLRSNTAVAFTTVVIGEASRRNRAMTRCEVV